MLLKQAAIFLFLKKTTVPLLAITDQYPFLIILLNYLKLLVVTLLCMI
jgi:hypothetical protein